MRVPLDRPGALLAALLVFGSGCAGVSSSPTAPAGSAAAPGAAPVPAPTPVAKRGGPPSSTVPVPTAAAPSGTLLRIGVKSDLAEFVYGPPGQRWIVASAGRAEILRGTMRFRPEGAAAGGFEVQAGAFSMEAPAREREERLAARFGVAGTVAFSADRGVYRVLLGSFPDRPSAEALAAKLRDAGEEATAVEGRAAPAPETAAFLNVTVEDGGVRRLSSPADIYPADADARILLDAKPYRGSLRVAVNPRGLANVINRVDLEEYLYGVVPAEMGPKRYDELEALKAQTVAARTYALAHRGQFESEGYDLCATARCQVYSGLSAEDPLSNAAVEATRGLVLASGGQFADALFTSTCGGRTENVENIFARPSLPYLVSVDCGELATSTLPGALLDRKNGSRRRTGLEWRGLVLAHHVAGKRAGRAAWLEMAQKWAGVASKSASPSSLAPSAVYPSLLAAFGLTPARALHLAPREEVYFNESPSVAGHLSGPAREAYDFSFGSGSRPARLFRRPIGT